MIFDCDQTLIDTRAISHLLPKVYTSNLSAYGPWREAAAGAGFPPVQGAKAGVHALLSTRDARPFLVTGRDESLESATREWLQRNVPELSAVEMSFRPEQDFSPTVESKARRIHEIRIRNPGVPAILVDDDRDMALTECMEQEDRLLIVSGDWSALEEIPCLARGVQARVANEG